VTALLARLLQAIGAITVVSGVVQLAVPAFVLRLVGGEPGASALHFFGIVGMFMLLFGLLMVYGVGADQPAYPLWIAGAQKFGAAAAVMLGVFKGLFGPLAWGVSGFDFLSGILVVMYLLCLRRES
jgi:hypothetical protein